MRQHGAIWVPEEVNLLEVFEGGGLEAGVDGGGVDSEVLGADAELAAGPLMGRKDAADNAGERLQRIGGKRLAVREDSAVEVERGGAPEVTPTGGEGLGAGGILGGEERDYLTQNGVG